MNNLQPPLDLHYLVFLSELSIQYYQINEDDFIPSFNSEFLETLCWYKFPFTVYGELVIFRFLNGCVFLGNFEIDFDFSYFPEELLVNVIDFNKLDLDIHELKANLEFSISYNSGFKYIRLASLALSSLDMFVAHEGLGPIPEEAWKPIKIDFYKERESIKPIVNTLLNDYITAYINNSIKYDSNVYEWVRQREFLVKAIVDLNLEYGKTFWIQGSDVINDSAFKFDESLIALSREGVIEIKEIRFGESLDEFSTAFKYLVEVCSLGNNDIAQANLENTSSSGSELFYFGNSVTDVSKMFITKATDGSISKRFNQGKQRCIWKFCIENCDKGTISMETLNGYIKSINPTFSQVTEDDFKALYKTIEQYSDISIKDLRSKYLRFKIGEFIEFKKVP